MATSPVSKKKPAARVAPSSATEPSETPVTSPATPSAARTVAATKKPAPRTRKPAATPAATAPAKPAAKAAKAGKPIDKPVKAAKAEKPAKTEKPKKPKLVRDSFTMPEDEYVQIAALKKRLMTQGISAKKSELLRAGLALLSAQTEADLAVHFGKLTPIKTGRPAK